MVVDTRREEVGHPGVCGISVFGVAGEVLYAHGCTLVANPPCEILATSGAHAFPLRRPVCAISPRNQVCLLGSSRLFANQFFKFNADLLRLLLSHLLGGAERPLVDVAEYRIMPDMASLAKEPMACFELPPFDPLPKNVLELACIRQFRLGGLDQRLRIQEVATQLNVGPLTLLMKPAFQLALPTLLTKSVPGIRLAETAAECGGDVSKFVQTVMQTDNASTALSRVVQQMFSLLSGVSHGV